MSGIEDLTRRFEGAGLAAPPIPAALEPHLRELEPWVFATREIDPVAMYSFDRYLVEALAEPVHEYAAVSHAGHGANSYGLNYHLVHGPLAVFAQTAWGGVYMDAEESAAEVTRQFSQCAELIAAAEASVGGLPAPPARLIVAESTFRARGVCRWLDAPLGDTRAAEDWLRAAKQKRGSELWIEGESTPAEPYAAIAEAIDVVRARG